MYKVGDTLVLKHSHGILDKGETVTVEDVEEGVWDSYWLKVRSTKRYHYHGIILVREGKEQNDV